MNEWYVRVTLENRDDIIEYIRQHHKHYLYKYSCTVGSFFNVVIFGNTVEEVYFFPSISEKEEKTSLCNDMDEFKHKMLEFRLTL